MKLCAEENSKDTSYENNCINETTYTFFFVINTGLWNDLNFSQRLYSDWSNFLLYFLRS